MCVRASLYRAACSWKGKDRDGWRASGQQPMGNAREREGRGEGRCGGDAGRFSTTRHPACRRLPSPPSALLSSLRSLTPFVSLSLSNSLSPQPRRQQPQGGARAPQLCKAASTSVVCGWRAVGVHFSRETPIRPGESDRFHPRRRALPLSDLLLSRSDQEDTRQLLLMNDSSSSHTTLLLHPFPSPLDADNANRKVRRSPITDAHEHRPARSCTCFLFLRFTTP